MANTPFIKGIVDPPMVAWVQKQIGVELRKRSSVVGISSDNRQVGYELDTVSEDNAIGLFASASASHRIGEIRKYFLEASILTRLPLTHRIMVFTN